MTDQEAILSVRAMVSREVTAILDQNVMENTSQGTMASSNPETTMAASRKRATEATPIALITEDLTRIKTKILL